MWVCLWARLSIRKTDAEFILDRLKRVNIIVEKEIYEFNLFWFMLIFNKSWVLK